MGILWGFLPVPAWVSCPGDIRGAKLAREDAEHNTDSGGTVFLPPICSLNGQALRVSGGQSHQRHLMHSRT